MSQNRVMSGNRHPSPRRDQLMTKTSQSPESEALKEMLCGPLTWPGLHLTEKRRDRIKAMVDEGRLSEACEAVITALHADRDRYRAQARERPDPGVSTGWSPGRRDWLLALGIISGALSLALLLAGNFGALHGARNALLAWQLRCAARRSERVAGGRAHVPDVGRGARGARAQEPPP